MTRCSLRQESQIEKDSTALGAMWFTDSCRISNKYSNKYINNNELQNTHNT